MKIDPNDPRSPYRQAADDLRKRISKGEFSPGHLPSIRNLATEYGVAAQTMQNALRELRNDKIVVTQQGRAFFVRNPDRPETGVGEADAERLAAAEAGLRDLPSPRGTGLSWWLPRPTRWLGRTLPAGPSRRWRTCGTR